MLVTMHTGVPGYKLALGEVQPVLDSVAKRLGLNLHDVELRDSRPEPGAPTAVVTARAVFDGKVNKEYEMVIAQSGPISQARDLCDALAHLDAGRHDVPMCPRALKDIEDAKKMATCVSLNPKLNLMWAIIVPEQSIYWLISAIRSPSAIIMSYAEISSTPR